MNDRVSGAISAPVEPTGPAPHWYSRRWLPRWRIATWLTVVFAGIVLLATQIAGRRVGFTEYRYGWPFSYLERDYRQDAKFATAAGFEPPAPQFSYGGTSWSDLEKRWLSQRYPITLERWMTPWSTDNIAGYRPWSVAVDLAIVALVLAMLGWLRERLRSRSRLRPLQFSLRTVLLLVILTAIACGQFVWWRRAHDSDLQILDELHAKPPGGLIWAACDSLGSTLAWHPPRWLPDSVAKLGILAPLFERADGLTLADATDSAFDRLDQLPFISELTLENNGPSGRALDRVAQLSSLKCLDLNIDHLSGEGIEQLSALPKLKNLMIDGIAIDDEAVLQVNSLTQLEYLAIERTRCSEVDLHGLSHLHRLAILCLGAHMDPQVNPLWEVSNLPADQQPKDGFWHPRVRLAGMACLADLFIEGASLDPQSLREICDLEKLQSLSIVAPPPTDSPSLRLSHAPKVETMGIGNYKGNEIIIDDFPKLESVSIQTDGPLHSVGIKHMPRLRDLDIEANQSLALVEFSETENLQKFVLETSPPPDYGDGSVPPPMRPVEFRGLASLRNLKHLELMDGPISTAVSADVSQLTCLESLNFRGAKLTDANLSSLRTLENLRELNLSETDVSVAGLRAAADIPHLATLTLQNAKNRDLGKTLPGLKASHPGLAVIRYPSEK